MLMRPSNEHRAQLLEDLLSLRKHLETKWLRGGWKSGDSACLMGSMNLVLSMDVGPKIIRTDEMTDQNVRLGRLVMAIYKALYGPKADMSVTFSEAQRKIITFNDQHANLGAVLLLVDRAMQVCMEPVVAGQP